MTETIKKKKKQDRSTSGTPLFFYLPEDIHQAFMTMCRENRRSITAEATLAIESRLKAEGLMPIIRKN